jgi:hypothetical protein
MIEMLNHVNDMISAYNNYELGLGILVIYFISIIYVLYAWGVNLVDWAKRRGKVPKESIGHLEIGIVYVSLIGTAMTFFLYHPILGICDIYGSRPAEPFLSDGYIIHVARHYYLEGVIWITLFASVFQYFLAEHILLTFKRSKK